MRTTIVIDEKLLRKAMKATGLPTKQAVVEAGLRALIQSRDHIGTRKDEPQVLLAASNKLNSSSVGKQNHG